MRCMRSWYGSRWWAGRSTPGWSRCITTCSALDPEQPRNEQVASPCRLLAGRVVDLCRVAGRDADPFGPADFPALAPRHIRTPLARLDAWGPACPHPGYNGADDLWLDAGLHRRHSPGSVDRTLAWRAPLADADARIISSPAGQHASADRHSIIWSPTEHAPGRDRVWCDLAGSVADHSRIWRNRSSVARGRSQSRRLAPCVRGQIWLAECCSGHHRRNAAIADGLPDHHGGW